MTSFRLQTIIAILTLAAIILGFSNWYLKPEAGLSWLAGMVSVPMIWLAVIAIEKRLPLSVQSPSERRYYSMSVILGASVLVGALFLKLFGDTSFIGSDLVKRIWGITLGGFLIFLGNAMPKILPNLNRQSCEPVKSAPVQRFAGWALFLGGIGYIGSWILLPIEKANSAAMYFCLASVLIVAGKIILQRISGQSS